MFKGKKVKINLIFFLYVVREKPSLHYKNSSVFNLTTKYIPDPINNPLKGEFSTPNDTT